MICEKAENPKTIELKELCEKALAIFEIADISELGNSLMSCVTEKSISVYRQFSDTVSDLSVDWLQKIFQYYMADRKEKKQDYTPKSLARALCMLAKVNEAQTVYDMCAGSGSLTIQAWNINPDCNFICQEFDEKVIPFLLFNLALRNMNAVVIYGDVLAEEQFKAYKIMKGEQFSEVIEIPTPVDIAADVCISNPPYNMKWKSPVFASLNERYKFGVPPESNANYAFISAAVQAAERAVLLLPNGVLITNNSDEKDIIRNIIAHNLIDCIAVCPDNMFETTKIGTCLYSLKKNKTTATVEMVDMRKECTEEKRLQNGQYGGNSHTNRTYEKTVKTFSEDNINALITAVNDRTNKAEFSAAITLQDIKSNEYILNPARYIELEEIITTHREYADILNDINRIVSEENSCKLVINETLAKALGFDISLFKADHSNDNSFDKFIEKIAGGKLTKHDYITFTKNKGEFTFKANDPEHLSTVFRAVVQMWKQHIMYLNEQENVYLAELRDALLPDLMSGSLSDYLND